jgi:hypothetical protein
LLHKTKRNKTPNGKPKNKQPAKEEEPETEVEVVFKKKTSNKAPDPDAWRGIIAAQEQARKERIENQRQARLAATTNRSKRFGLTLRDFRGDAPARANEPE